MPRLAIAFFCSGFAALLCQIVWQRMLGIFAGSDTISAALVVGAFLAGLGLGSIIGAKLADRLSPFHALLGFALAEAGVAGFALVSKLFLYDVLATDLAGVVDNPAAIFALCFAGLVLPTTLMGASLPLLARAVATSLETVAERIGSLYGLNTLGAGLGALLGGWVLVGNLGFVGALALAAGLDVLAALLALTLLPGLPRTAPPPPARLATAAAEPFGSLRLWCLLVFLSGYIIVAMEIVWVRLMGQVGQYHAYLFPTVLGIFLLADGAGIAVASRLVRRLRDPRPAFFLTQAGGFALGAALILLLVWALPHWPINQFVSADMHRLRDGGLVTTVLLTLAVVGPPSFLIGMTFPFVQRAVQQDLASVGARVGWVQLANILGNAAGSILTGLVTFHLIGTAGTLRLLAALSLLLMLGWLWRAGRRRRPELALAAACALALVALPGNAALWSRLHAEQPGQTVSWSEDRSGIAFFRDDNRPGAGPHGPFFIQGFSQGRIPFLPIHQFLGAVGPLLHPDPKAVLCIGIGSGGTPWAAGVAAGTQSVRAIELVGPVLTAHAAIAARYPASPIAEMVSNPRWALEYGDGRRALARGDQLYDVIQADAILPEGSHSGLLYSAEFLRQVRSRLAPGGLYVQWGPSRRVVATFAAVFPHTLLLMPGSVLIGSDSPIPYDPARLARRFAQPEVTAHLGRGNREFRDYDGMFAQPALAWAPGDPRPPVLLTDVFPRDEFYLNNGVRYTDTLRRPEDLADEE
ncbi:fused MFS/spermidine synthase [Falsiroseomonas selenitidurans]|uniref:Fused MFS/spermidine synthase n=1 Tax=Falsiroseomonas selenitidurans TaxID=2716335 RepID=A0ABX1DY18_9PROT|nr:fused MFS/spermidine synthase [Falsiroseomonas selenitidurans]NKC29771.1 fused MFS/spermidine synthase [Falsiroseomonas selenitidurans]